MYGSKTYRGFFSNCSVILLTSPVKESRNTESSVNILFIYPSSLLYVCLSAILLGVARRFEIVRVVLSTSVSLVDKDSSSRLLGRCLVLFSVSLLIAGVWIVEGGLQLIVTTGRRGEIYIP
jgi:uncharacterized membrane protein